LKSTTTTILYEFVWKWFRDLYRNDVVDFNI